MNSGSTLSKAERVETQNLESLNRDSIRLILENFGKEYPDAPRRDPKEFADGSFIERLKIEKFVESLKQ